jgi:hypothetical protein
MEKHTWGWEGGWEGVRLFCGVRVCGEFRRARLVAHRRPAQAQVQVLESSSGGCRWPDALVSTQDRPRTAPWAAHRVHQREAGRDLGVQLHHAGGDKAAVGVAHNVHLAGWWGGVCVRWFVSVRRGGRQEMRVQAREGCGARLWDGAGKAEVQKSTREEEAGAPEAGATGTVRSSPSPHLFVAHHPQERRRRRDQLLDRGDGLHQSHRHVAVLGHDEGAAFGGEGPGGGRCNWQGQRGGQRHVAVLRHDERAAWGLRRGGDARQDGVSGGGWRAWRGGRRLGRGPGRRAARRRSLAVRGVRRPAAGMGRRAGGAARAAHQC